MNDQLIEKLNERADAYEAPYQGNHIAFIQSGAFYAIATVMRELAIMLEQQEPSVQTLTEPKRPYRNETVIGDFDTDDDTNQVISCISQPLDGERWQEIKLHFNLGICGFFEYLMDRKETQRLVDHLQKALDEF